MPGDTPVSGVVNFIKALADRNTSKAGDESICLATLLDLPINDILAVDESTE